MNIPSIEIVNGRKCFCVDGRPYWIRGGELSNSCANNLRYMEEKVWPWVTNLGLNTLEIPLAWEDIEPEQGRFDFALQDEIIRQAASRGLHIIFTWFGLWKNAQSSYVPQWIKRNPERWFRSVSLSRRGMKSPLCSISPLCNDAIAMDTRAFARFMEHLRDSDAGRTVIAMQVENEVGLLGSERDFSPQANAVFNAPVPAEIADAFGASGTWQEAFGSEACAQFMSWCFACAVNRVAQAGKDVYPLPMYTNAWTIQYPGERPGFYPVGGPVAEYFKMWKLCAPAIDWMSPDVYLPGYVDEVQKYAQQDMLMIPEALWNCKAASQALYTAGLPNTYGFSPYAIERMGGSVTENGKSGIVQDVFSDAELPSCGPAAVFYREANLILDALWPRIHELRAKGRVWSLIENGFPKALISTGRYDFVATFIQHGAQAPDSSVLLLQEDEDTFLAVGSSCELEAMPKPGQRWHAEYLIMEEMQVRGGGLAVFRTLNGDDQWPYFGEHFRMIRFTLHRVPA